MCELYGGSRGACVIAGFGAAWQSQQNTTVILRACEAFSAGLAEQTNYDRHPEALDRPCGRATKGDGLSHLDEAALPPENPRFRERNPWIDLSMLTIFGKPGRRDCDGLSRRSFLRIGALGTGIGALTLSDPEDSQKIVTFFGSPPNSAMSRCTHRRAAIWSRMA